MQITDKIKLSSDNELITRIVEGETALFEILINSSEEIYEFNLIYCDAIVRRIFAAMEVQQSKS